MQKLIQGIHNFQQTAFKTNQSLFERLAGGQQPLALFITCSDSRIDPNLLTQTEPGELFILRNAGNIVPPYSAGPGGEAATIEYAVKVLQVPDIIVCGHSQCGAMGGLLQPESLNGLDAVKGWLTHAQATARNMDRKHRDVADPQSRLTAAVEENVLVQLENLRSHPSVAVALADGNLTLHGWKYTFETGEVHRFDPQPEQFVAMC